MESIRLEIATTISELRDAIEEYWMEYSKTRKFLFEGSFGTQYVEIHFGYDPFEGEHYYTLNGRRFESLEKMYHYIGESSMLREDIRCYAYRVRVGKAVFFCETNEEFSQVEFEVLNYVENGEVSSSDDVCIRVTQSEGGEYNFKLMFAEDAAEWACRMER